MRTIGKKLFVPLLFAAFVSAGAFYYFKSSSGLKKSGQDSINEKALVKGGEFLAELWRDGNYKRVGLTLPTCAKLPLADRVSSLFYRCNPEWLSCLLRQYEDKHKASMIVDVDGHNVFLKVSYLKSQLGKGGVEYLFFLSHVGQANSLGLPILLKKNCHELTLPENIYPIGPFPAKKADWKWDNVGRHILVDRFQVTFAEIKEWENLLQIKTGITFPEAPSELYRPAFGLTKKQMKEYCRFLGKEVLSAAVYDAATFFPVLDVNRKTIERIPRGPYPWTRVSIDSSIESWAQDTVAGTTEENCGRIFSKECALKFPSKIYDNSMLSYMGLGDMLGGEMEYLDNPQSQMENLKVSSQYLPISSSWHRLGRRAFWDGEGFSDKNFIMERELSDVLFQSENFSLKVAFRCMKDDLE